MRLRGWLLLLVGFACAGVLTWALLQLKSQPPEVQFARAARETIHSSIPTDGKVEPIEWAPARAERGGPVINIMVQRGQHVAKDAPLVEMDATEAKAALAAAQTRIAQAHVDLAVIHGGGRATDLAEISSSLEHAKHDRDVAQSNYEIEQRLLAKQAGTKMAVDAAKQKVDDARLEIDRWEKRRAALAASPDGPAAQARLDDAAAAARLAEAQIKQSIVRAPIEGTVYQFDLKPGAYLNAGDTIASIGRLDRVRVNVNVDEPDLGHVNVGMPVIITWDALAGREWTGVVDKTPTQIVTLGTRQVGEVVCVIRNPDRDLLPGTHVNIEIRSETVADVVTIPKEGVRTEHAQTGVFLLNGDRLTWEQVKTGVSNTTRIQVEGLKVDDAVALFSEKALSEGMVVKAVFPSGAGGEVVSKKCRDESRHGTLKRAPRKEVERAAP
jgi:HlyD family secretion protein